MEQQLTKIDLKPLILLILSILFIPAAYLFVAAVFIVKLFKLNRIDTTRNKFCLLLYAYLIIGVMTSEYKLVSFVYCVILFLSFYTIKLFSRITEFCNIRTVKKLLYIVSLIVFIIGIFQYFNPHFTIPSKWVDTNEFDLSKRVYSTFFNPNIFGFFINIIILLACENIDFKKINLELIVFISGLICLILTFSRTAWASLIASLVIVSIFNKKYIKFLIIISTTIICTDFLMGIGRSNPVKVMEDSSFLYRLEVWKTCIEIIKDNFISGIGFGTLFKYVGNYSTIVSNSIEHSHNIYIQIFTETGILGFSIFIIILSTIFKNLYININKQPRNEIWITAFAILIMTLVHGLVDSVALTPQILMILCIYIGSLRSIAQYK